MNLNQNTLVRKKREEFNPESNRKYIDEDDKSNSDIEKTSIENTSINESIINSGIYNSIQENLETDQSTMLEEFDDSIKDIQKIDQSTIPKNYIENIQKIPKTIYSTPNIFKEKYLKTLQDYDDFIEKYRKKLSENYLETYNNEDYKIYIKQYIDLQFHFQNKKLNSKLKLYGGNEIDIINKIPNLTPNEKKIIFNSIEYFERNYKKHTDIYIKTVNNIKGLVLPQVYTNLLTRERNERENEHSKVFRDCLFEFLSNMNKDIKDLIEIISSYTPLTEEATILYFLEIIMKLFMYLNIHTVLIIYPTNKYYLYLGFLYTFILLSISLDDNIKTYVHLNDINEYLNINGLTPLPRKLNKIDEIDGTCAYNCVLLYLDINNKTILPNFIQTSFDKIHNMLNIQSDISTEILNKLNIRTDITTEILSNLHLLFKINITVVLLYLDEINICYDTNRLLTYDRLNNKLRIIKPKEEIKNYKFVMLNEEMEISEQMEISKEMEISEQKYKFKSLNSYMIETPDTYDLVRPPNTTPLERFLYDSPLFLSNVYFKRENGDFVYNGAHAVVLEKKTLNEYLLIDSNYSNKKINDLKTDVSKDLFYLTIDSKLNENTITYELDSLEKINYTNIEEFIKEVDILDKLKTNSISVEKANKYTQKYRLHSINSSFKYFNPYNKFLHYDYEISNTPVNIEDYIYYFHYTDELTPIRIIYKKTQIENIIVENLLDKLLISNNPFSNKYQVIIMVLKNNKGLNNFFLYLGDLVFYNLITEKLIKFEFTDGYKFTRIDNVKAVDFSLNIDSIYKIRNCVANDISNKSFDSDTEFKGSGINFKSKNFGKLCLLILIIIIIIIIIIVCIKYNSINYKLNDKNNII